MKSLKIFLLIVILAPIGLRAQNTGSSKSISVDYNEPKKYVIGGVRLSGVKYNNKEDIIAQTGLNVGDSITIPGDEVSSIVKRLWMARLFSEVSLEIDSVSADKVFLNLYQYTKSHVHLCCPAWIRTTILSSKG